MFLRKLLVIMRFTIFLLLVSLLQVSANSYSQSARLTVNYERITISEVFSDLEENTAYSFVYRKQDLDLDTKINYNANNANVFKILDDVLSNQNVSYKVDDRIVIIMPNEDTLDQINGVQEQKSVSGSVSDSSGQALPGVSILIKGTTTGVISDFDGNFSLIRVPENAVLVFSFIGMKTVEFELTGQTSLVITMIDDAIGLEEVIAVGYGFQKKSNLTGAVISVQKEQDRKSVV